jgi:glucose/arabinose dehydrogenase
MRVRMGRVPWLIVVCGLVLSGCARFDDRAGGQTYVPQPQLSAPAGPQPKLPEIDGNSATGAPGPAAPRSSIPPPQGCTDFDKAVIATCLDTVTAVVALPGDPASPNALAGERKTGRVLGVAPGGKADEVVKVPVDPAGDGGLTGLALSPSYAEDQLVFAYVTTATDNRVVRFTKGQQPKPVLTGIPKGATGNRGALMPLGRALLVATGDAGNPAAAADPNSLAGKVLRVDTSGNPAQGNPIASSRVYATGLHSPGGLCRSTDSSRVWVTDRSATIDALFRVQGGGSVGNPAWTWPDRPGVAGCVDGDQSVLVAASIAGNLQSLPISADGSVGGKPKVTMDGKTGPTYGRLSGLNPIDTRYAVAGTVNRDGGRPVSSDDRVVIVQIQPSAAGGAGKD